REKLVFPSACEPNYDQDTIGFPRERGGPSIPVQRRSAEYGDVGATAANGLHELRCRPRLEHAGWIRGLWAGGENSKQRRLNGNRRKHVGVQAKGASRSPMAFEDGSRKPRRP